MENHTEHHITCGSLDAWPGSCDCGTVKASAGNEAPSHAARPNWIVGLFRLLFSRPV